MLLCTCLLPQKCDGLSSGGNALTPPTPVSTISEYISISVESPYEARRCITDKDATVYIHINRTDERKYIAENPTLEKESGGEWGAISYRHANGGLIMYEHAANELFLNGPLQAGRYRLRQPIGLFVGGGAADVAEYVCEFDVIPYDAAPAPEWDAARLRPSVFGDDPRDGGIEMIVNNPEINKTQTSSTVTIKTDSYYMTGHYFTFEVKIDGEWYIVPSNIAVTLEGYHISPWPDETQQLYPQTIYPVTYSGLLPAGQYRAVKELMPFKDNDPYGNVDINAMVYAFAEFIVEETLEIYDYKN